MIITWKDGSLTSVCGELANYEIETDFYGMPLRVDLCNKHYEKYKKEKEK